MAARNMSADQLPLLPPSAKDESSSLFESQLSFFEPSIARTSTSLSSHTPPGRHHAPLASHIQSSQNVESQSDLPSYQEANPYGRHKSEADYLAALRAWVKSKQYIETDPAVGGGLKGFYGDKTLEERRERLEEEKKMRKEQKKIMKEEKRELKRAEDDGRVQRESDGRRKSLGGILGRRKTVAV